MNCIVYLRIYAIAFNFNRHAVCLERAKEKENKQTNKIVTRHPNVTIMMINGPQNNRSTLIY